MRKFSKSNTFFNDPSLTTSFRTPSITSSILSSAEKHERDRLLRIAVVETSKKEYDRMVRQSRFTIIFMSFRLTYLTTNKIMHMVMPCRTYVVNSSVFMNRYLRLQFWCKSKLVKLCQRVLNLLRITRTKFIQ